MTPGKPGHRTGSRWDTIRSAVLGGSAEPIRLKPAASGEALLTRPRAAVRRNEHDVPVAEPSDELMEFALFALDHAAGSVIPAGGPLVPFAMVEADGEKSLTRFVGDMEEGQQQARQAVRSTARVQRAAVAWDGFLTLDDIRMDAVFVEAFEAGATESVVLAQRYRSVGRLRKRMERVGNPAVVGRSSPLF